MGAGAKAGAEVEINIGDFIGVKDALRCVTEA